MDQYGSIWINMDEYLYCMLNVSGDALCHLDVGQCWACSKGTGAKALRMLLEDRKIAVATHNMFAYRRDMPP